jgi:hypothetical protein
LAPSWIRCGIGFRIFRRKSRLFTTAKPASGCL